MSHTGRGNRMPQDVADRIVAMVAGGKGTATAAELCGYTDRTVYRLARRDPEYRARLTEAIRTRDTARLKGCGTQASYRRGCRCRPCTKANTDYVQRGRLARRAAA